MRNLDECRAEIFLRSEQRIRRNRSVWIRATSLCLLCFVSVVCAAAVFPALFAEPSDGGTNGGTDAGNFLNLKAEILGSDYRKTVVETADVVALRQVVEEIFSMVDDGPVGGGMDAGNSGNLPEKPPLDGGPEDEIRITFFERDGVQAVYVLLETVLRNECTGEEVVLTAASLRRLSEALGFDFDS